MSAPVSWFSAPPLVPYARSRRRPMRRKTQLLSLPVMLFNENIGWRLAAWLGGGTTGPGLIAAIRAEGADLEGLDEAALAVRLAGHRFDTGPRSFALIHEVMRREIGFPLRDNQLACAAALLQGGCVELRTGEGKTYAAGFAALVAARMGAATHVITVNEYLAGRDHAGIAPIAARLGLRSAVVLQKMEDADRLAAYDCDIVYGANKTFVFDHLRDRREAHTQPDRLPRQTGQIFAVVDEADSVLIDDATVPMILSEQTGHIEPGDLELFCRLRDFAATCEAPEDRQPDPWGSWRLTPKGVAALEVLAADWPHPVARSFDLVGLAERALAARLSFREGEAWVRGAEGLEMIDQSTGRLMPDRKWDYGMQQLVELTAGLEPSPENRTVGQVTQQSFFRQYALLSGLTGTARECRGELWAIYRLAVRAIAPHAPSKLRDDGLRLFPDAAQKYQAIFDRARRLSEAGRAILIGLNDVREAQDLAAYFTAEGFAPAVLDARSEEQEAALVAAAGGAGRVTIATHLAGRGTDIAVSSEVLEQGGLHVIIGSTMASARLERQLCGRAGRKGQPGSHELMIAVTDRMISEGERGLRRGFFTLCLKWGLAPRAALARIQAGRDVKARRARRRALLREQKIMQQLGYR